MPRSDISLHVVHFTKGENEEAQYAAFRSIVLARRINGNTNLIRGGYRCVCFTEAPLIAVETGLANPDAYQRYSPFGVMFDKKLIFAKGGRPAIYQHGDEFEALPDTHKWRHVRYEPDGPDPVDFTWEREWRLQTDGLGFGPDEAALVVPRHEFVERLAHDLQSAQAGTREIEFQAYAQIMDELLAAQYADAYDGAADFSWTISVLEEL